MPILKTHQDFKLFFSFPTVCLSFIWKSNTGFRRVLDLPRKKLYYPGLKWKFYNFTRALSQFQLAQKKLLYVIIISLLNQSYNFSIWTKTRLRHLNSISPSISIIAFWIQFSWCCRRQLNIFQTDIGASHAFTAIEIYSCLCLWRPR